MTTRKRNIQTLKLEDLSHEKLSIQINESIAEIELCIRPGFRLWIDRKDTHIWLYAHLPSRKLLTWLVGAASALWLIIRALSWLLPILNAYYLGLPGP